MKYEKLKRLEKLITKLQKKGLELDEFGELADLQSEFIAFQKKPKKTKL